MSSRLASSWRTLLGPAVTVSALGAITPVPTLGAMVRSVVRPVTLDMVLRSMRLPMLALGMASGPMCGRVGTSLVTLVRSGVLPRRSRVRALLLSLGRGIGALLLWMTLAMWTISTLVFRRRSIITRRGALVLLMLLLLEMLPGMLLGMLLLGMLRMWLLMRGM